jgi:NAD(P)-dependent dehydrogenase (short-subunit alcohol dehydrogenase family)
MKPFSGRRALVTGGAGGIGSAIVERFVAEGADVAIADLRPEAIARVQERIGQDRTLAVPIDMRKTGSFDAALNRVWRELGPLDILVNCAALYPSNNVLDMSESDWDAVLNTNLRGAFFLTQAVARRLVTEKRPGHVVNITSGNAERARIGAAHYSASKAGLEMLTRTFALELAPHRIHVNSVSPGFIDVASEVNPLAPEYVKAISATIPWPRLGKPSDIASAVLFLCSNDADWITGITLRVDGGRATGNTVLPSSRA